MFKKHGPVDKALKKIDKFLLQSDSKHHSITHTTRLVDHQSKPAIQPSQEHVQIQAPVTSIKNDFHFNPHIELTYINVVNNYASTTLPAPAYEPNEAVDTNFATTASADPKQMTSVSVESNVTDDHKDIIDSNSSILAEYGLAKYGLLKQLLKDQSVSNKVVDIALSNNMSLEDIIEVVNDTGFVATNIDVLMGDFLEIYNI